MQLRPEEGERGDPSTSKSGQLRLFPHGLANLCMHAPCTCRATVLKRWEAWSWQPCCRPRTLSCTSIGSRCEPDQLRGRGGCLPRKAAGKMLLRLAIRYKYIDLGARTSALCGLASAQGSAARSLSLGCKPVESLRSSGHTAPMVAGSGASQGRAQQLPQRCRGALVEQQRYQGARQLADCAA